jgi:hypothetical protein
MNPLLPTRLRTLLSALLLLAVASCAGPQATAGTISVVAVADGIRHSVEVPSGGTVQQALAQAGIGLGPLDRVSPAGYTVLTQGVEIAVTRVTERFEVETVAIPFEHQTIRNESLPEGETRLLQAGSNGIQQVTYRILDEEGVEVSRAPVQTVVVQEPLAEIVMVGAQAAYAPLEIEGTLAYLSGGNAWVMRDTSGGRRPLVVTGDLDGRIFRLSPDGRWLLFTRLGDEDSGEINTLWVVSTTEADAEPVDLNVANVVHFADWAPTSPPLTIAYSTVEPSPSAPGWQANNDLRLLTFNPPGFATRRRVMIEPNAGGQYGWWGTSFAWGSSGGLAYARADSIGTVDLSDPFFAPLFEITPLQTLGDWAWVPGVAWGRDGRSLYFIDHGTPLSLEDPSASPVFNLVAMPGPGAPALNLIPQTGMFSQPVVSPDVTLPSGEDSYRVAFLQALSPLESADSRYRLVVVDRDGSNARTLFPPSGEAGLEPQTVVWSPDGSRIALVYRGDLWVIDIAAGSGQPLTGDGQTVHVDWMP